MFGLMRVALVVVGLLGMVGTARAAKQEFPQFPVEHLEVHVVRTNEVLMTLVEGSPNGFTGGGIYIPGDATYQRRLKAANDAITPARQTLSDYDFNAAIESRLRKAIVDTGLSKDAVWKVVPSYTPAPIQAPQNVLQAYTTMVLSPDFRSLELHVNLHLDRREPGGEYKPRVRKRFIRSYQFRFVADPVVGDPLTFWNGMPRARYEQLIANAVDHIAGMMAYDFSETGRATWWSKPEDRRTPFMDRVLRGQAIPREDGAVWVIGGKNWGRVMLGFKPVR
jgi:hypothetical protein